MQSKLDVELLRIGPDQFLRIPREFEFEGDKVIVRKDGDRLIIEPFRRSGLLSVLASLEPVDKTLPDLDRFSIPLYHVEL